MTRVLDIDLDFFLSDVCPMAEEGERPNARACAPWTTEDARAFLARGLGLSEARPIPGRAFETHDGALDYWDALIREGRLTPPFHVTHVDAHSDLGIAQGENPFVRHSVLCRAPETRADIAQYRRAGQLSEANYLLFALSFRWIGELVNLRNPMSRPDMPPMLLTEGGRALQLKSAFPALFEAKHGEEPRVPYLEIANGREYTAPAPFDFLSLAASPRYSPPAADALIPAIMAFARESPRGFY